MAVGFLVSSLIKTILPARGSESACGMSLSLAWLDRPSRAGDLTEVMNLVPSKVFIVS